MDQIIISGKITSIRNGIPVINENPPKLSDIVTGVTIKYNGTVIRKINFNKK